MAKLIEAKDPHAAWATMSVRTLVKIFLYGVGVGVLTYALYQVLGRFVFEPILCRESLPLARCESSDGFASGFAIVLGSIAGLVLLVRERVYRPILAILGVAVVIWGLLSVLAALPIVLAVIVSALVFGIAYGLFSWLVQPTSLLVSLIGVVIVVIIARVALSLG